VCNFIAVHSGRIQACASRSFSLEVNGSEFLVKTRPPLFCGRSFHHVVQIFLDNDPPEKKVFSLRSGGSQYPVLPSGGFSSHQLLPKTSFLVSSGRMGDFRLIDPTSLPPPNLHNQSLPKMFIRPVPHQATSHRQRSPAPDAAQIPPPTSPLCLLFCPPSLPDDPFV